MGSFASLVFGLAAAAGALGLAACGATSAPAQTAAQQAATSAAGQSGTAAKAAAKQQATPAPSATARPAASSAASGPTAGGAAVTAASAPAGNPDGKVYVPPAGRAVNTSHPTRVIGNGTPASCTSAAVVSAVAKGGVITFNCGPAPVTILMTATAVVRKTDHRVVLDGGGKVTLSGGGKVRILFMDTCQGTLSTDDCVNQPYPKLTVQNITFTGGYDGTHQVTGTANVPADWYGGVDGGGAIYAEGGQFKAVNSRFVDNKCYQYGPDLGGGAVRALAQYRNRPVYITDDTFTGGRCSNGGALSSIAVQWDVLNSVFTDNHAIGWGANPAASGTPGGGSGGAIYTDGDNYDVLVAGTIMRDNVAREGGGAIFCVVDSGWGQLTLKDSHLHHNTSEEFQTYPGIFDHIDGKDVAPIVIDSTDS
jgi:hypothetical protein